MVEESTVPSYNYDCKLQFGLTLLKQGLCFKKKKIAILPYTLFLTFSRHILDQKDSFVDLSSSGSIETNKSHFRASSKSGSLISSKNKGGSLDLRNGKVSVKTRALAATMSIERYYSSMREEISPLSPDAIKLLTEEDYVGFFKACGPTYTRSIRRAQEVVAYLSYVEASKTRARQYNSQFQASSGRWQFMNKYKKKRSSTAASKYKSVNSSLTIEIYGWGLGLSQDGSDTLVATSIDDYIQVMKFAFRTMTMSNSDSFAIGMVYGIEVVPWVNNLSFQANSRLGDEDIILPMPRSLIPKAYPVDPDNDGVITFVNDESTTGRPLWRCRDHGSAIDKYGYCCEIEQLIDVTNEEYRTAEDYSPIDDVCRPMRSLDPSYIKDTMSNNGEFIARLDSAFRYKLTQMAVLEKCISSANAIPDRFLPNILEPLSTVKYDRVVTTDVSLLELRLGIDPNGDYGVLKHFGQELDEWIEMFYSPCYGALYGMNIGTTPETEVSYLMTYPWHAHAECMRLTCISNNMRWDRDTGDGCVPGLSNGVDAEEYGTQSTNCATDPYQNDGDEEVCKHDQTLLDDFQKEAQECWDSPLPVSNVDYYLTNYCLPDITGDHKSLSDDIMTKYNECRGRSNPTDHSNIGRRR
jgi:hypothetical protein